MILLTQTIRGVTRKCDARCFDAKTWGCHCICGGSNHGVGLEKALQNIFHGDAIEGVEVTRRAKREMKRREEKG
jgi:hypothetical protein